MLAEARFITNNLIKMKFKIQKKILKQVPKYVILPFLFVTIIYWMANILNNANVYFQVVFTIVLNTQVAIGYGTNKII